MPIARGRPEACARSVASCREPGCHVSVPELRCGDGRPGLPAQEHRVGDAVILFQVLTGRREERQRGCRVVLVERQRPLRVQYQRPLEAPGVDCLGDAECLSGSFGVAALEAGVSEHRRAPPLVCCPAQAADLQCPFGLGRRLGEASVPVQQQRPGLPDLGSADR